ASLDLTAKNGRTAVHECLRNLSSLPCLKLLLDAGAETNLLDRQGFTPLSMLGHHNKLDSHLDHKFLLVLSTLLHFGANPNLTGLRASPNFIMASAVGRSCSYEALRLLLAAGVEPVPAQDSSRIPRPSPLAFAFDLRKLDVARLLVDGIVYTPRDTVHITKYLAEPPHIQHLQNVASSALLSLRDTDSRQGSGHASPRRVSSSGSLLSSANGTPRSSTSSFFSLSSSQSSSPSSKQHPPQRSASETHSNGTKNGACVPTSISSPSLSLSSKQSGLCKRKNKSSSLTRTVIPSPNMVFPDSKVSQNGLSNHHICNNNDSQGSITNGNHCNNHGSQCNGSLGYEGLSQHSHHHGNHKHRSSSNSRSASQQSLNGSRRPSLTDVLTLNLGRSSSPGPGRGSQRENEVTDTTLHQLALAVCHSTPSLQQLCRRAVHRAISARHDRARCVEKLPVWKKLQRYILFDGPEYQLQS
ncbi:hypothetical protein EGW08_010747, partial [Elysia chlorotica]